MAVCTLNADLIGVGIWCGHVCRMDMDVTTIGPAVYIKGRSRI